MTQANTNDVTAFSAVRVRTGCQRNVTDACQAGRMLFAAVALAILVYGVISSMLGTLLPALGFSGVQNSTLALTQASGLALASISAGPFLDSRGKKLGLVCSLAAIAVALVLMPHAEGSFALAACLWFLLGLGGGVMSTASNSMVSDIGGAQRSAALNFSNVFFGVGLMITPYLASGLLGGNVRGLCYFAAALATVTLLIQASMRMPRPAAGAPKFNFDELGVLIKNPTLQLLALFAFLYVSCEVGMSNWLVKDLIARGVPRDHALKIMSLGFALGLLTGRLLASRILAHAAATKVMLGAAVFMTATTLWVLGSGSGRNETAVAIAVFCAGLSMAPAFPTALGLVGDVFPTGTATAMGFVITSGWVGLAFSSQVIGTIAGSDESHLSEALLIIPGFAFLLIVVSTLLLRRRMLGTA